MDNPGDESVASASEERGADGGAFGCDWRPLVTADGSSTLRHPLHGEAFHSEAGAWTQAWERYVLGCRIPERLAQAPGRELRVLDVGTGLGLNLAALARAVAENGGRLRVTTLEASPAVLRAASALWESRARAEPEGPDPNAPARSALRWVQPVQRALWRALAEARGRGADWPDHNGPHIYGPGIYGPMESGPNPATAHPHPPGGQTGAGGGGCTEPGANFRWPWVPLAGLGALRLLLGDARATLPELAPGPGFDAVFLDPFSPRVEPELWAPAFLAAVASRMAPGSWLATYSAATDVRAALAAAGLRVGSGGRVGSKRDGSVASPDLEPPALPPRVVRRIARRAAELAPPGDDPRMDLQRTPRRADR